LTSVIVTDREKAWPALLMGTTVGDEEKVYAKREDRDPVFVIPKSVVQNLTPSLFELREKRLAAVEKDKVVKIELKWPDSSVILTKKEGEWISLSHQVEGKADMFKVEDAISSIVDTKAKEFFEGVDNLQEYGFTEPSCVVTLYGEEGEKLVHLVLGADAGQDRIFVKRTGDGLTASVEKSFLENLPRTADQVLIPVEDNNSEAQVEDGETGDAVEGRASN